MPIKEVYTADARKRARGLMRVIFTFPLEERATDTRQFTVSLKAAEVTNRKRRPIHRYPADESSSGSVSSPEDSSFRAIRGARKRIRSKVEIVRAALRERRKALVSLK